MQSSRIAIYLNSEKIVENWHGIVIADLQKSYRTN